MNEKHATRSDLRIYEDVLQELRWDPRVGDSNAIGIAIDRGVVTLTGWVQTWVARLAAREAAHRVLGVQDVADELHVKLAGTNERTDADIARAARDALEWNVLVPHERLNTTVADGVLTLEGAVETWAQRDDAARAVADLTGVREVRNEVEVKAPPIAPDTVRTAIDDALHRHAAHAAKHVMIAVHEGTVVLSGTVPSWAERTTVEGAARGIKGVSRVENNVRVL